MTLPGYEYTPIARKTFLKMLNEEFNTFIKLVQQTLYKAQKGSYGRPFLHVVYDMSTNGATLKCLGSGICFVDVNYNRIFIPCVLVLNNFSHAAAHNAD